MTEVVDTIKIEITLHHCRDELRVKPLRQALGSWWPIIYMMLKPCSEGCQQLEGDKITVRWSHSGLEEIPEESGGDN